MKAITRRISGVIAAIALSQAFAWSSDAWAGGGTGRVYLTVVKVETTGNTTFVKVNNDVYNFGDGCATNDGFILDVAGNPARYDRLLRTLTAAHISNAPVEMWISGCAWSAVGHQKPRVYDVAVVR